MWNLFLTKKIARSSALLLLAAALGTLAGCGGGSPPSSAPPPTTPPTPAPTVAAYLDLSATPTTVKSDASTTSNITVTALNSERAAIGNVTVTMSTDTGILGAASVVTDATGTAKVTFSSGGGFVNRTATITATSGTVSARLPVQIVGSTITLTSSGSTIPDDGKSPVTLTVTALDPGGNIVPQAAVALTKTGSGNVTMTPASGVTDATGKFTSKVAGASGGAGTATIAAAALGATATTEVTVTPTAATFSIDQQKLNGVVIANETTTAMKIGDSLEVRVNAPSPLTSVVFATTTGVWNGSSTVVQVPVVSGKATATLSTTQAGVATIQVMDPANSATNDTLMVAMTSATAASITLQATPAVVPRSVGTTTGTSTLIAMVRDANGFPVGGAPVAFSIVTPTGGGETVAPVLVLSAATPAGGLNLGEARASFTSGSLSSTAQGVRIRASVVGTSVETEPTGIDLTPSGNDVAVVIGGTAGSVAFGQATVVGEGGNGTTYVYPMSVLVSDSNGNPAPLGTVVNLSLWPIAWSTGTGCVPDLPDGISRGTFLNEDINENLIRDPGEDGTRQEYDVETGVVGNLLVGGKLDGFLTPTNSAGGSLPATLTTDASGVAAFDLTYPKTSAIWTAVRIRARTVVQGSDAVGQIIFRLGAAEKDASGTTCRLPPSPYSF